MSVTIRLCMILGPVTQRQASHLGAWGQAKCRTRNVKVRVAMGVWMDGKEGLSLQAMVFRIRPAANCAAKYSNGIVRIALYGVLFALWVYWVVCFGSCLCLQCLWLSCA